MVIIKKYLSQIILQMPIFGGPQRAEICIYGVKFVKGKLTKDIRSYAARYLELRILPYTSVPEEVGHASRIT